MVKLNKTLCTRIGEKQEECIAVSLAINTLSSVCLTNARK